MKPKIIITLILSSLIFLNVSCDKKEEKPTNINFTNIGKGSLNGSEGVSQSNIVISNTTDWQNLMNKMGSEIDEFTETNIDFNAYQVIAIILEVKMNGWDVEITSIVENTDKITVSKKETEYLTAVVTQPYHIVKIPKTSKPIVFK